MAYVELGKTTGNDMVEMCQVSISEHLIPLLFLWICEVKYMSNS